MFDNILTNRLVGNVHLSSKIALNKTSSKETASHVYKAIVSQR